MSEYISDETVTTAPRLSEREAKALNVLAGCFGDEGNYLPFASIAERSGLDPKHVRRTVRALARKGFAEYGRGLWTEDGAPAGSGYRCTVAGYDAAPNPTEHFYD
jgi:DNA-binding Lrp family transcriptional regulator